MSERFVVMPRGINVGTRNRVPMAELRSVLAGEGHLDVATILQSGNVILTAESEAPDEVAAAVQQLLSREFDVNVPCVARTANQIRAVLDLNPLREAVADNSRYLVNFFLRGAGPGSRSRAPRRGPQSRGPRNRRLRGVRVDARGRQVNDPVVRLPREATRCRGHRTQLEHAAENHCQAVTIQN